MQSLCNVSEIYNCIVGKRMTVVPLYFNPRCDEDDNRISHKGCGAILLWYYWEDQQHPLSLQSLHNWPSHTRMDGGSITVLLCVTTDLYVGQCLVPNKLYSVIRHDVIYVCAVDDIAMVPFPLRHRIVRSTLAHAVLDVIPASDALDCSRHWSWYTRHATCVSRCHRTSYM